MVYLSDHPSPLYFLNIYMLQFDHDIHEFMKSVGGSYRRYSDDILLICSESSIAAVEQRLEHAITELGPAITISKEKTEKSKFEKAGDDLSCDKPLTYLGFTFDGQRVMLRDRTLSRYYRRMTYATRHAATAARLKRTGEPPFRRKLFRELTHLGKASFYTYVRKSAGILGDETPRRQLRRHFVVLHRKLRDHGR
jgi:hypothetical protein